MEEWKEYKLEEVCSRLRSGKGIKSDCISNIGLFPVIGGNGMRGYTNKSNFKGECAVIGRQGANCGNVRFFMGEAYMTEHAVVAVGNELADSYFLARLLSLMHLGNLSAQSAQPGLSIQTLSKQIIRLPSISYQREISTVLKSLDDKIELNRRINDNLEQQAQALFKSWFVDFEPFKKGKFIDSELGMIPEGWQVEELGNITNSITEKVGKRTDVKVLSPVNTGDLLLSEEYFTKQVYSKNLAKYIMVAPNDFAYNPARINIGSIGMNTFDFSGCVSPVYVVFRCEKEYHHFFNIFKATKNFKEEVNTRAIGGVRQTLSYKDFSLIKIVYPPKEAVEQFNKIYSHIMTLIKKNVLENKRLHQTRDTLLPKLMSGELKINDINN
ncbi:restriction endonuclease subunit S [Segatella maculosa]|uniref:restriction endonuclease subunit S n=1 Tax=Segatella maculosa TaxID=439703 RepID=UPI000382A43A|nr:restriction endonuclease subunit S [Segatella maculosa]